MDVKELRLILKGCGRFHQREKMANEGPRGARSSIGDACYTVEMMSKVGVVVRSTNQNPTYHMPRNARVISELVKTLDYKSMVALESTYFYGDNAQKRFEELTDSTKLGYWVRRAERELIKLIEL